MISPRWMIYDVVLVSLHASLSLGQQLVCVDPSSVNLDETLPYFKARFPNITVKAPTRPAWLGGRNLTYCCIEAVDEYLRNNCSSTGYQVAVNSSILDPSAQFPCGAAYIGDKYGAPEVSSTYNWATQHCPWWQISEASKVDEWAQLLVSFILPSVVFSFNVPRPRKLRIWEKFFPEDIGSYRVVVGLGGAVGSAIFVTVDAVVWLMISFAFAGPLLLSGLYEAQLDKRMLDYLQEHIKHDKLPIGLRARILFTILCGNLDMYPAWSDTMDLAKHLDELDKVSPEFARYCQPAPQIQISTPTFAAATRQRLSPGASPAMRPRSHSGTVESDKTSLLSHDDYDDEQHDTAPLQPDARDNPRIMAGVSVRDHSPSTTQQDDAISLRRMRTAASDAPTENASLVEVEGEVYSNASYDRSKTIRKTIVRLRSMLACQYSFGTTIGGPVIFFLGSFIYALLEIEQHIGDEDIAEALAFGMWWCIIPHIAAVAGLLLAGNNPNILEGIVSIRELRYPVGDSLVDRQLKRRATIDLEAALRLGVIQPNKRSYSKVMEKVYEAKYTPAWMWDRGKCKQDWLLVLFTDSWLKYQVQSQSPQSEPRLPPAIRKGLENFLVDGVMLGFGDWLFLWIFAFLLIFIPCMFGFLTAFFTPVIGIGCRASTFLVYMGAQTLLLILWTYYLTGRDKYWAIARDLKRIFQGHGKGKSKDNVEKLINALHEQAVKDTNMSNKEKKLLGRRGTIVPSSEPDDAVAKWDEAHPIFKALFYFLCFLGFIISLLTSMGGTLMQLMGVYRNNLCLLNARDWTHARRADTFVTLSTNTSDAIAKAERDWTILGSFSVVFLGIVCYIGWWYQKRLRAMFKMIAGRLDGDKADRELM